MNLLDLLALTNGDPVHFAELGYYKGKAFSLFSHDPSATHRAAVGGAYFSYTYWIGA